MSDPKTLTVYAAQSERYASLTNDVLANDPVLTAFIASLPPHAHALDLGCGPGAAATVMAQAGLHVHATDAVPKMIALVPPHLNIHAEVKTFDQIDGIALYHGIWANFSLLHAARAELPRILLALHKSLHRRGVLHIAMKLGEKTARDALGRQYTYVTEQELRTLLADAGFTVTEKNKGRDMGLDGTYADWIALAAYG